MNDIKEYIDSLKASAKFGPQVVCHKSYSEIAASYAESFPALHPSLTNYLDKAGIQRLYSHQRQAIDAILDKKNVVVATPTASGKSLIYTLPVLNDIVLDDPGHSLFLFPLKALAQDQLQILQRFFSYLPLDCQKKYQNLAALFDGDTSAYQRRKLRDNHPFVLLTNPEMLHLSLLPFHQNWRAFFSKLRYVVIDEVHSYRGVLGNHMAWVLRRLRRLAEYYGAQPTFILLSATIGNPGELGKMLLDQPIEVLSESGSPQAERNFLFINPWDSAAYTASQLLEAAVKRGLRTIVYTQSRRLTELINVWTEQRLGNLAAKLSAYRAGYLPEERRIIERMLFSGELLGVISTSALELGIDIGDLDLCILVGYPGSIMATKQRGGRVGRGRRESATILIAQEDALDQHFMRQPEDFFGRSPESAVLNPDNAPIMKLHLQCCAMEMPLSLSERLLQKSKVKEIVLECANEGSLLETASGGSWISSRKYPQRLVQLRGGGVQLAIIDSGNGEIIGEIDGGRALKECHPGAVYLHRSVSWIVQALDLDGKEVLVQRESPAFFTRPMVEKHTEILEVLEKKPCYGAEVSWGKVRVTEKVNGYQKRNNRTQKLISTHKLSLPEQIIETEGLWLDIPQHVVTEIEEGKYHFMGAIHAMEHAMIALFPLFVLCDRNDIGGISCPLHQQTEQASIFIYDGYAGGIGLAHEAFTKIDSLLLQTKETVASCPCDTGCPSCVHSPKCGSGNRPIDKRACLHLLEIILKGGWQKEIPGKTSNRPQQQEKNTSFPDLKKPNATILKGLAALPKKFVVYDVETKRSAEDVGGWHQARRMGVSLAVLYDSELDECITYLESEMAQLIDHLEASDLIIGFNNKRFDNLVLSAYTTTNLAALPCLDLLEEISNYLGYRLSLNSLAEHTLGEKKTSDGLQALQWYKEGRIDLIQKYCKKDVEITRNLLFYALENRFLLFANKAKQVVKLPLTLEQRIYAILHQGQTRVL